MTVLGLILARGGSKRVPRKNVRLLNGKPLIAWTIEVAKASDRLSKVVVSSEDTEILRIASEWGAIPLVRPWEMATDHVTPYPAILHAIMAFKPRHVCLLQPTSPFRETQDIDACVDLAMRGVAPAVASVARGKTLPNGAVYVGRYDWLNAGGNFDSPEVLRCAMPAHRSLDIDTEEDWAKAEMMAMVAA